MKNNGCKKGFTLIELLVVVLIIGILAAIAMPQYQKAVNKAKMAEVKIFMGNARRALEIYVLGNGMPQIGEERIDLLQQEVLDVSLKNGLICREGQNYCEGKNFNYQIECNSNECWASAFIDEIGGGNYLLLKIGTSDGQNWTPEGIYYTDDPKAVSLCQEFAKTFGGSCHAK